MSNFNLIGWCLATQGTRTDDHQIRIYQTLDIGHAGMHSWEYFGWNHILFFQVVGLIHDCDLVNIKLSHE